MLCDIQYIARLVLHQIGEDHRIASYAQEASTSHGLSIIPSVSSTLAHMQPIRGRGRGRVDRRGRGRDGGPCHGLGSDNDLGTLEPTLSTSIPSHTYPSPEMFIPPHTYTFVPYPVSPEPTSIAVDITLSSHPLSSHTLPPIDDTILDLLPELGPLPARRPHTRHVH